MPGKGKGKGPSFPVARVATHPASHHRETERPRSGLTLTRSSFVGPMPPPDLVAEYEAIRPGAARFFFDAVERQSAHRQALELRVVNASISNERVGMWLAFVLAMAMVLCGTFLISEDKDPQGLAMIAGTLAALCGVFVYSRRQEQKEHRESDPADDIDLATA